MVIGASAVFCDLDDDERGGHPTNVSSLLSIQFTFMPSFAALILAVFLRAKTPRRGAMQNGLALITTNSHVPDSRCSFLFRL